MATKMRTSLKKLRGALKHERKDSRHRRVLSHLEELDQATKDMIDMRDCYDRLLSAAAATANSVYEFSESLGEMGDCLLEKTALTDDEGSGKVLLMLGKVQLELQKLVDGYRSHIFQTITVPSECLLHELRIVEEMKRGCDIKRETYDHMRKSREKGRLRSSKGECCSSHQLQEARDEYDEETNAFVFRMKSLRQGQSRSLLTQAARHHAAQLAFFRRSLKSLETIEPFVKLVAEEQHIDYHFRGLEDDDSYDMEDDTGDDSESVDESELSFDYGPSVKGGQDLSASGTSMDLDDSDVTFPQVVSTDASKGTLDRSFTASSFAFSKDIRVISRSESLLHNKKFDPAERLAQMRSPSQKFSTYVLPTPKETKSTPFTNADDQVPPNRVPSLKNTVTQNMWHSSPLQRNKYEKIVENFSGPITVKTQPLLKESNDNAKSSWLRDAVAEGLSPPRQDPRGSSDYKKIKRQAFSGPLTGDPWPYRPSLSASGPITSGGHSQPFSGPLLRNPMQQGSTPKLSSRLSSNFVSSPKINELHELPRPPSRLAGPPHHGVHSAPLMSESSLSAKSRIVSPRTLSALPSPLKTISRSHSIPSRSQMEPTSHSPVPLKTPDSMKIAEEISSPAS